MRKILIVDDETHLTYILSSKLEQSGYRTIVAGDGEEGLALALAEVPDLIISDYQMPLMCGLEMCLMLRADARTARTPVLMLTARGHRIAPEELRKTNVIALMPKPFSARELVAKVRDVLGDSSAGGVVAA